MRFVDAPINDIVNYMISAQYLEARTHATQVQCIQFLKLHLKNKKLLPLFKSLVAVVGWGKNIGINNVDSNFLYVPETNGVTKGWRCRIRDEQID